MVDPTRGFTLGGRIDVVVITARKRSLGQGNIFTPVCHSVHRGVPGPEGCVPDLGGACSRGSALGGCLLWGGAWSGGGGGACSGGGCLVDTPRMATAAGGTHPTGMHSCCYHCFVD